MATVSRQQVLETQIVVRPSGPSAAKLIRVNPQCKQSKSLLRNKISHEKTSEQPFPVSETTNVTDGHGSSPFLSVPIREIRGLSIPFNDGRIGKSVLRFGSGYAGLSHPRSIHQDVCTARETFHRE
jgi:hypothetical protein